MKIKSVINYRLRRNNTFLLLKLIATLIIPFVLFFIPVDWLNAQHSVCIFKNIFGTDCYGCGITRAIVSAIQFDFVAAYNFNKLIIVVYPLFTFVWIRSIVNTFRQIKNPKPSLTT